MKALLIKGAKNILSTLLNSDSESRNKVLGIIVAIFFSILIIPATAISLPGVLLKGALGDTVNGTMSLEDFRFDGESLKNNKMYLAIRDSYIKYLDSLEIDFDSRVEEIKSEYTYEREYYVDVLDSNGVKIGEEKKTEKVIPEVIKDINITKPELRHLMAYIGTKYLNSQTIVDNYQFDYFEAIKYLRDITTYQETISGKDPIYYTAWTSIMDLRSIAEMYFTVEKNGDEFQEKQDQFILSFESMEDFEDELADSAYDYIDLDTLNIHENGMEIPHMLQYDPQWGQERYGDGNIAQNGCAILSMAMIESYFSGQGILPTSIANWSDHNGYYYNGQGTAWSFFPSYSRKIGLNCTNLGKSTQQIIKALEDGKPVIASMGPGTFTKGGHFIVLRGITKNGKILVNDPNDNYNTKKFYEKEFNLNLIFSEAKNFWSFGRGS